MKRRCYGKKTWYEAHRKEVLAQKKAMRAAHPERVKAINEAHCRKGGKYYDKFRIYQRTGLQRERNLVRVKHAGRWCRYKRIVAPDSQLHHEWIPETPDYRGVALVEADQHLHGIIDVIEIMECEITLLTEKEVRTETRYNVNHN